MKANLPKSFLSLPTKEKEIINRVMTDEVNRLVNAEEAQMQKIWIQMACIILHNNFNFSKDDLMMFVGGWKSVYRKNVRVGGKKEQDEWIKAEITKIFDGEYPYEWVDSLEELK